MSHSTAAHRRPATRVQARQTDRTRPSLAVVSERRRPRAGRIATLAGVVLLVALAGSAIAHTHLVSGQRELDRLDAEIRSTEAANISLRLEVAELESPSRIVSAAQRDGMVVPAEVTWVSPDPSGASQVVPRPTAPAPEADTDSRAAEDPSATDGEGASR